MAKCINISSKEYKALLAITGLTSLDLHTRISKWQKENNSDDFPSLAELGFTNTKNREVDILFENPVFTQSVLDITNLQISEVTYTNDDFTPCAAMGLTDSTSGSNWRIVKDFNGYPKHSQGGVDISISNDGVSIQRNNSKIKARYGLFIKAADGLVVDDPTDPPFKKLKTMLNPYNWGVTDYTDQFPDKDKAFAAARRAGEKEYLYNGVRYTTLSDANTKDQFRMYGNVNAGVFNEADDDTKEFIFKQTLGNPERMERYYKINTMSGNPSYKHTDVIPEVESNYRRFRKQPEESLEKLMEAYKNRSSAGVRPRFNAFTNTIYGYDKIAEEAHAYRNENEGSEILSFIKSYIKDPYITSEGQYRGYNNKEHFEFDTHKIVQPILQAYLEGEIDEKEIPKRIQQLRDINQEHIKNNLGPESSKDLLLYLPYSKKSAPSRVEKLQEVLIEKGYNLPKSTTSYGALDGIWGPETEQALLDYLNKQKK